MFLPSAHAGAGQPTGTQIPLLLPNGQPDTMPASSGGVRQGAHAGQQLPGGFTQGQLHHMPLPGSYQNTTNPMFKVGNTKIYNEHYPHLYLSESSATQANINLPHFVLGYLRYLMSGIQGKQSISPEEFQFRLQHLINTMQVTVTNSSPTTDFMDHSWAIAREYSNRVFKDLEEGHKSWGTMGLAMQTDAYIFSKDSVKPPQAKPKPAPGQAAKKQICRNFNTVPNEGQACTWEVSNPGKRCFRLHSCSYCYDNFNKTREHRDLNCEAKKKGATGENDPFRGKGSDE